ncbi:MAG: alkaline phosphatase family protein, partial [Nitrospirae bacterium]|nr:alkaline phosphatase family protein [Nitrospirota bacterium]
MPQIIKSDNISLEQKYKRVILIGMDGLDPKILSSLMGSGDLPNFSRLSLTGVFSKLATSIPAQSPVAWASIATGNNPGYHGVFDFLSRRVTDYMPELAIFKINPKNPFGKRESMFLPVMYGNSFWDHTSAKSIPSTVLKWPVTFQPKQNQARLYAGLGVPDLKGGLGRYAFYTDKDLPRGEEGIEKIIKVQINGNRVKTYISGPLVARLTTREDAKAELNITIKPNSEIEIAVEGKQIILNEGTWSEWIEVKFKLGFMRTA